MASRETSAACRKGTGRSSLPFRRTTRRRSSSAITPPIRTSTIGCASSLRRLSSRAPRRYAARASAPRGASSRERFPRMASARVVVVGIGAEWSAPRSGLYILQLRDLSLARQSRDAALAERDSHELRARAGAELPLRIADVRADGFVGDMQFVGDLRAGATERYVVHDLTLTLGQRFAFAGRHVGAVR